MFGRVAVKVHSAVAEPPAVRLTLDGQDTERSVDGTPLTAAEPARVTVPLKPFRLWRVMKEEPESPDGKEMELGLGERLNPGLAVPPMLKPSEKGPPPERTN